MAFSPLSGVRNISFALLASLALVAGVYLLTHLLGPAEPLKSDSRHVNAILVVIDALRPDHLGCYGYQRDTSPNIDRLAQEATRFTQAITAGGWTAEAVPSILTGTYPFVHGSRGDWKIPLNANIDTLPRLLGVRGIRSALLTNHLALRMVKIKDGFDFTYLLDRGHRRLTIKAINWIRRNKDRPFFMYLHYEGAHAPYLSPAPYRDRFLQDGFRVRKDIPISKDKSRPYASGGKIPCRVAEDNITDTGYYISLYDASISYVDAAIGYLMDSLRQLALWDDTLIILTADHGEMLGEHNIWFTHKSCYESNIKVPLIIKYPRIFPEGKVVSQQVSLIDLAPTILDILGIDIPAYMQGESLAGFFEDEKFKLRPYIYVTHERQIAIRGKGWKLIRYPGGYRMHNLIRDPQERQNLANKERDKFDELRQLLDKAETETAYTEGHAGQPLDRWEKEVLRSLGYVQ
jgi:arylsulfatase A-like enzyme